MNCYSRAKYTVLWFIPIINLQLFVPQTAAGDNLENSSELNFVQQITKTECFYSSKGEIKVNLKTAYQELEKTASTVELISFEFSNNDSMFSL